jgi:hypothetical protein
MVRGARTVAPPPGSIDVGVVLAPPRRLVNGSRSPPRRRAARRGKGEGAEVVVRLPALVREVPLPSPFKHHQDVAVCGRDHGAGRHDHRLHARDSPAHSAVERRSDLRRPRADLRGGVVRRSRARIEHRQPARLRRASTPGHPGADPAGSDRMHPGRVQPARRSPQDRHPRQQREPDDQRHLLVARPDLRDRCGLRLRGERDELAPERTGGGIANWTTGGIQGPGTGGYPAQDFLYLPSSITYFSAVPAGAIVDGRYLGSRDDLFLAGLLRDRDAAVQAPR